MKCPCKKPLKKCESGKTNNDKDANNKLVRTTENVSSVYSSNKETERICLLKKSINKKKNIPAKRQYSVPLFKRWFTLASSFSPMSLDTSFEVPGINPKQARSANKENGTYAKAYKDIVPFPKSFANRNKKTSDNILAPTCPTPKINACNNVLSFMLITFLLVFS